MKLPSDSFWSDFRAVASGVCVVGLLAWIIWHPKDTKHEEQNYVQKCKGYGGVVAQQVITNKLVCIKKEGV